MLAPPFGLSTGVQSMWRTGQVGSTLLAFLLVAHRLGREFKQYLAVAPFPNSSHSPEIGVKVQRPSNSCIQIWSLSAKSGAPDAGQMKCEMVLCLDNGPAFDLKWCPLPSHDEVCVSNHEDDRCLTVMVDQFGEEPEETRAFGWNIRRRLVLCICGSGTPGYAQRLLGGTSTRYAELQFGVGLGFHG